MPTDPGILSRLGQTFVKDDDESQAFHYHSESYRHYPVNLEVISWLGVWYVKSEMYERAIQYFERAAEIQPKEVKWRLMVTRYVIDGSLLVFIGVVCTGYCVRQCIMGCTFVDCTMLIYIVEVFPVFWLAPHIPDACSFLSVLSAVSEDWAHIKKYDFAVVTSVVSVSITVVSIVYLFYGCCFCMLTLPSLSHTHTHTLNTHHTERHWNCTNKSTRNTRKI
jgi:tetratricopeptide (TPR) repeat protein